MLTFQGVRVRGIQPMVFLGTRLLPYPLFQQGSPLPLFGPSGNRTHGGRRPGPIIAPAFSNLRFDFDISLLERVNLQRNIYIIYTFHLHYHCFFLGKSLKYT